MSLSTRTIINAKTATEQIWNAFRSEDSQSYCMGTVRRSGSTETAEQNLKALVKKFKKETMWNMSRITLVSAKPQCPGSPVKHVIDLTKTNVSPVLQSTTVPKSPTPPESLATIVQLHFLALVRAVEK